MPRLQYASLKLDFLNSFEMLGKKMSISLKKKCFMDEERFLKREKQDWVGIPQLEQLTNLMKKMRRNLLNKFFSNCLLIMKELFQQKPSHAHIHTQKGIWYCCWESSGWLWVLEEDQVCCHADHWLPFTGSKDGVDLKDRPGFSEHT